jgi:hypothetical protein
VRHRSPVDGRERVRQLGGERPERAPRERDGPRVDLEVKRSISSEMRASSAAARTARFTGSGRPTSSMTATSSSAPSVVGPTPNPGRASTVAIASKLSSSRSPNRA